MVLNSARRFLGVDTSMASRGRASCTCEDVPPGLHASGWLVALLRRVQALPKALGGAFIDDNVDV